LVFKVAPWATLYTVTTNVALGLFIIVLSDYISLFFVLRFLQLALKHPIKSSIMASLIGLLVVVVSFFVFRGIIFIPLSLFYYHVEYRWRDNLDDVELSIEYPSFFLRTMAPAFIIHLWLPLFALSSLVVRLTYLLFHAVEKAQWFLKQGDAHPLKAIGIVATIIVFGSAMLVKEAWAYLLGLLPCH
jgi:hypothetical protein